MYLESFMKSLKGKYEAENRGGIHISDLVLCPRRSAHRRLNPQEITPKELNFYTSGSSIHEALQILAKTSDTYELEKPIIYNGVEGHVDIYDRLLNVPIEFKSYRGKSMENPKEHHISQLKYYMAILGAKQGILIYQCLMNFEDKPFVEFIIEMDQEERIQVLKKLEEEKESYQKVLEGINGIMLVRGIYEDKTLNWLCKDCPLLEECRKEYESKQ